MFLFSLLVLTTEFACPQRFDKSGTKDFDYYYEDYAYFAADPITTTLTTPVQGESSIQNADAPAQVENNSQNVDTSVQGGNSSLNMDTPVQGENITQNRTGSEDVRNPAHTTATRRRPPRRRRTLPHAFTIPAGFTIPSRIPIPDGINIPGGIAIPDGFNINALPADISKHTIAPGIAFPPIALIPTPWWLEWFAEFLGHLFVGGYNNGNNGRRYRTQ